jgi:ABC-2 type transport system ATP-binding protein
MAGLSAQAADRGDHGPVIEVSHLSKTYGTTVAVDDVSFSVTEGEIFGILGPNGAGKTTTVECVAGLRVPDWGTVRVMGCDPQVDRRKLHAMVGVQLQASALPSRLKVREILDLYQSFYRNPENIDRLIESVGLAEKQTDYYKSLSGGQKQRLSFALALVGRPKIAVLDEMTTGLDPQARHMAWDRIESARDRGVTVVLVTHYMDEAERLCDRVALIDRGRVVAIDGPSSLARQAGGGTRMRFVPSGPLDDHLLTALSEVSSVERQDRHVVVTGSEDVVNAVILTLAAARLAAKDLQIEPATLEDAFLSLTGRPLYAEEGGGET